MNALEVIPEYFTVQEVAKKLRLAERTIRRMFRDQPGVVKISKRLPNLSGRRKTRDRVILRIPQELLLSYLREHSR